MPVLLGGDARIPIIPYECYAGAAGPTREGDTYAKLGLNRRRWEIRRALLLSATSGRPSILICIFKSVISDEYSPLACLVGLY